MKTSIFLFIAFAFILSGCSTADAEKVADEFHKKLDEGKVDYIVTNLIDHEESTEEKLEEFSKFLGSIVRSGEQVNRKKNSGFSKNYNNGVTTVKLGYTFEVNGELLHERLVLVSRDEGYKILVITMHPDEEFVEDFVKDY